MVRALARVDLGAIERNAARLAAVAAPAALCAVVKADAYGHGMLPCARAAQAGGATWLAVATAGEARDLRAGGIDGPLLVMGALSAPELEVAVAARADVVAWREAFVAQLAALAGSESIGVHVKLDSGMGRLGTRDPDEATRVADAVAGDPRPASGRRDDPLRHRRRRPGLRARAARRLRAVGERRAGRAPRGARARRELRRHAARARRPLRPRALRHRALRHGPVPLRPGRARARAGPFAARLSGRGQARRAGPERRLRPPLRRRRADVGGDAADRLRRRGIAAG